MSDTITLGGRHFTLRPLKLGQLRHVLDALDEMGGRSGGALLEAAARVVAAGAAPAHPDLTVDAVLDIEATVDELNTAVAAILHVAGLRPRESAQGEPAQGEPAQGEPAQGEALPVASPDRVRERSSP